jgi:putative transposase
MLKVVHDASGSNEVTAVASLLDEIVRDGARAMLAAALQAEVAAYIEAHRDVVDEDGHRLVVRNGCHAEREVVTAAGAVVVRQPRVNDKRLDEQTGERMRFSSAILPAWARKSPQVSEVLPLLYLHGLSTSDFAPALEQFLGSSAGLSPATITRLTEQWKDDAKAFNTRSLADVDYVYLWVDGIHLKVRLAQDKVCLLVMIGVRADGKKELVALADGFRESAESWADLLRDCKRRGMGAPVLVVGDGALGFWKALREVFPDTGRAALLVPRAGQRPGRPAEVCAPRREGRAYRDLQRRGQGPRRQGDQGVCGRLRRKVAQGSREDHRACRRAPGVLRLPRRALDPPAHDQSDRVNLRHREVAPASDQGPRFEGSRSRNGVQAHRVRPNPLAGRERSAPRRPGPRRSQVQERQTRRTTPGITRRIRKRTSSRVKVDPQVLTIPLRHRVRVMSCSARLRFRSPPRL